MDNYHVPTAERPQKLVTKHVSGDLDIFLNDGLKNVVHVL